MAYLPDVRFAVDVRPPAPSSTHVLALDLPPQVVAALNQLVATGLFGLSVADCAERMICEQLRARELDGWLPKTVVVERKLAAKKRGWR